MKSTWNPSDGPARRHMTIGFVSLVIGVSIASYCGYMASEVGERQPVWLTLLGWGLVLFGLVLFLLGIFQSSIRR